MLVVASGALLQAIVPVAIRFKDIFPVADIYMTLRRAQRLRQHEVVDTDRTVPRHKSLYPLDVHVAPVRIAMSSYRLSHNTNQLLLSVGYILTLFACVVLHEFGHALTARRFGIKTKDITLFPMGGMARMEKMPESPKEEFLVAIAGPLVNVVIAGGLFLYMYLSPTVYTMGLPTGAMTADKFIPALFAVNVIMAIFNLIPAFPMDGGRIFRALLSLKLERTRATQIAANLGSSSRFCLCCWACSTTSGWCSSASSSISAPEQRQARNTCSTICRATASAIL